MHEWKQPTAIQPGDVKGWDVLHFEDDLIDQAVMYIPGFVDLNIPGHPGSAG